MNNRYAVTFSGGHGGGDPPVSIPNTEVKPSSADGTALRVRESRTLPDFFEKPVPLLQGAGFLRDLRATLSSTSFEYRIASFDE